MCEYKSRKNAVMWHMVKCNMHDSVRPTCCQSMLPHQKGKMTHVNSDQSLVVMVEVLRLSKMSTNTHCQQIKRCTKDVYPFTLLHERRCVFSRGPTWWPLFHMLPNFIRQSAHGCSHLHLAHPSLDILPNIYDMLDTTSPPTSVCKGHAST